MNDTTTPKSMAPTGERMVPESAHINTFWEHVYRYRFAAQFVKGKDVLDIASGEGYGSASLTAAGSKHVIGVDISEATVEHAKAKYGIDARVGDGERIPLPDNAVDTVISFETIEHVPSPSQFLAELRRVLKPDGEIVLSTPVSETYGTQNDNEHHVSELPEAESIELFKQYFKDITIFAQRPHSYPAWKADCESGDSLLLKGKKVVRNFKARLSVRSGRIGALYNADRYRGRTVDAILSSAGNQLPFNPYRIRPRDCFGALGPQYLVFHAKNNK